MTQEDIVKLRTAFSQVFNTTMGHKVLKYIQDDLCIYHERNRPILDGDISSNAMIYNQGRRDVFADIRKLLSPETVTKSESTTPILFRKKQEDKVKHPFLEQRKKVKKDD